VFKTGYLGLDFDGKLLKTKAITSKILKRLGLFVEMVHGKDLSVARESPGCVPGLFSSTGSILSNWMKLIGAFRMIIFWV
jgi:hypothetical protein